VPAVVDLAAMRDAVKELGGDPARINPLVPVDLIVDHSIQVDAWGTADALVETSPGNTSATESATPCSMGPGELRPLPGGPANSGICHQVNLEYIGRVIATEKTGRPGAGLPRHGGGLDSTPP